MIENILIVLAIGIALFALGIYAEISRYKKRASYFTEKMTFREHGGDLGLPKLIIFICSLIVDKNKSKSC